MPGKIYIASHTSDEKWRNALIAQLEVLNLESWDKSRVGGGLDTAEEIKKTLEASDLGVVIISSAALLGTDDAHIKQEFAQLQNLEESGKLGRVFALYARSVAVYAEGRPDNRWPYRRQLRPAAPLPEPSGAAADKMLGDLANEIEAALLGSQYKETRVTVASKLVIPPNAHLCCNRDSQEMDFNEAFHQGLKGSPFRPQFFFVHGDDEDRPGSLVQRLSEIELKQVTNDQSFATSSGYLKFVPLDVSDEHLDKRYERLVRDLCVQFFKDAKREILDLTSAAEYPAFFVRCLEKSPPNSKIIVIEHSFTGWNEAAEQLLARYQGFWADVQKAHLPFQFLVFFRVTYPPPEAAKPNWLARWLGKGSNAKQVQQALEQFDGELAKAGFLSTKLRELNDIEVTHVAQWASNLGGQDLLRQVERDLAQRLFQGNQQLPMKDV